MDPGLDSVNEPMVSEPVRQRLRKVVRKLLGEVEILFRLPVGVGGGRQTAKRSQDENIAERIRKVGWSKTVNVNDRN